MHRTLLASALLFSSGLVAAQAQSTAFTHQGQLRDNGSPASGIYDLRFTIYDALTAGSAVGGPIAKAPTNLTNGLFTVTLDFEAGVFNGADRWLEIGVRTNGSAGAYQALSPRQKLTATPYAVRAANFSGSVSDSQLSGTVARRNANQTFSGANTFNNAGNSFTGTGAGLRSLNASNLASGTVADTRLSVNVAMRTGGNAFVGQQTFMEGNVGIGMTNPIFPLDIFSPSGEARINLTSISGQLGQINRRSDRFEILSTDDITFAPNSGIEAVRVSSNGNVGIGTPDPRARLDVLAQNGSRMLFEQNEGELYIGGKTGGGNASIQLSSTGGYGAWTFYSAGVGRYWVTGVSGIDSWPVQSGNFFIKDNTVGATRLLIDASGNVGIGTTTPVFTLEVNGSAGKPGGGSWSVASDVRLKKKIHPLAGALDKLLALRGVSFEYINPEKIHELSGERMGLIAQEVEKVFPDWVETGPDGYKRVTVRGLESLVVEALRQLRSEKDAEIQELKQRLETLEKHFTNNN